MPILSSHATRVRNPQPPARCRRLLGPALLVLATLAPARLSGAELDPSGVDYWLAWPETSDVTAEDPNFDVDAEILVLTDSTAVVSLTASGPGFTWSGTTVRGAPARIHVPVAAKLTSDLQVEAKGIHLRAEGCAPVSVLFRVPEGNASIADDMYTALPVALLGREYYPDTYQGRAELVVLAVEDGTTVEWDNPHCPGPRRFVLDRGETVQHKCWIDSQALDVRGIVGTRVTADKPVAVYGGSAASQIINIFLPGPPPLNIFWASNDILLEQMRPVEQWDSEYRTVPFLPPAPGWPGDYVRILAACPGTEVTVDDGSSIRRQTLAAGAYWDLSTFDVIRQTFSLSRTPLTIRASAPIQVTQYTVGWQVSAAGDPSQAMVAGLQHAATTALAYVPPRCDAHLTIVAPAAATASVRLDGNPVASAWTLYPDGLYAWTRIDNPGTGEHRVTSSQPIAVMVYGFSLDSSNQPWAGAFSYPAPTGEASLPAQATVVSDALCRLDCPGQCQTLDAGPGWASYAWSTGETSASILYCPTTALDRVVVDLSDASGCAARGERLIRSLDAVVVDAGPDQQFCGTSGVVLGGAPTAQGGQPPYRYLWSPATDLDDPTLANPTATSTLGGTWQVTVTDALGCSGADAVSLTPANPPPPASLGNSLRAVRRGADAQFQWRPDPGASLYRLKHDTDKRQANLLTTLSSPVPDGLLVGVVPAPPSLVYYRVVGVNCADLEGP